MGIFDTTQEMIPNRMERPEELVHCFTKIIGIWEGKNGGPFIEAPHERPKYRGGDARPHD